MTQGLAVDSAKCKLGGQPSTDLSQALTNLVAAAVRSSSAASDPITEKLECFLDHRSLLGMLQQRAAPKDDHTAPKDPQQPLVDALLTRLCC